MPTSFDAMMFYRKYRATFNITPTEMTAISLIISINGVNDFPVSQQDIMNFMGLKKNATRLLLKSLVDKKLISFSRKWKTNNYFATLDDAVKNLPNTEEIEIVRDHFQALTSDFNEPIRAQKRALRNDIRAQKEALIEPHTILLIEREKEMEEEKENKKEKEISADASVAGATIFDFSAFVDISPPSPAPLPPDNSDQDEITQVFEYWKFRMNHKRARMDPARKKKITNMLKMGYTLQDLKDAIDGCAKSEFHMGQNERGTVYDDIELILRDAKHVDGFIKLFEQGPMQKKEAPIKLTRAQESIKRHNDFLNSIKWV